MARIVFDLDGTLVDSAPDLHAIADALLTPRSLDPVTLQETRSFIGRGVGVFITRLRAARGIAEGEQAILLQEFMGRYDQAVTLTQLYPGVAEALAALRTAGHVLGLCTNKPMRPTLALLRHLNMERQFTRIIAGDSLAVHKPDPAPLIAAFDMPGTEPDLYVGDSEVDAETASRAGVPFVIFTEGYRTTPLAQIAHLAAFDAFVDLPALVDRVLKG